MKALVTGANGLVGANLVRELLRQGHEVRGLVRETSDLRSLEGVPLDLAYGDVLDRDSLVDAAKGVDVVFHTAAVFAYWGIGDADLERLTVEGARNAVEAAHEVGAARLVLTSSSVVCGSSTRGDVRDEHHELRDTDPPFYYTAKARQEREARARAEQLGLDFVAVCPTITVGPHDYRLVPSNAVVVTYLQDPWHATFPGGCNVVHVEDVARGHVLAAEKGLRGGRYLLGSENMTWAEVHRTISELCGIAGPGLTATHTSAYLAATAMELAARFTRKPPASTRVQAKTLGRYYWYRHDKAGALGYAPRSGRQALADALAWLLGSPHVSRRLRARLRPTAEVLGSRRLTALHGGRP